MQSISDWLQSLGLAQYAALFEANGLDLEALALVSDGELEKLGVVLGHRKKLLKAIAEHRQEPHKPPQLGPSDKNSTASGNQEVAGERRQLTVLFCDMVGFTELANRVDPEVLQRIVRSYEDTCAVCITRYEGYVFQRLGDGIVAFFGYPLAHEGEAERAIRAGLEIVAALSKLEMPEAGHLAVRIGIATGMVVVSSAEKGAVGETMNLAARLQAIALPGSIVVSERVHRLAGGAFDYEDQGVQTLKGIAQPTRAYRILGVSEVASRFDAATQEGLTPLVGREQELGLLLERWALAQGGEGQVLLLSGEPGIGKSRILSALRERLQSQGAQALRFQCSPYYVNSAFWPMIDNLERALKFGRDESSESKLDKLEALIVRHYGRPLSDVRFIASMLSIPCDERYGAIAMTPQKYKDETLRSLVDLAEATARKQPSVMLFEDVHWADPTTLEDLDLLIDRVRTIPLLIVLTHRPEFQSRWGAHGHVTGVNLSKLTRAQSAAMIYKLARGKSLPAELVEEILAKTDGVPLFVEELTKSILESGELKEAGDRYEYAGTSHSITIPATLRDSLMERLDRFMPVKEIAQIGAAIGREFSYELISAVAPRTKAELDDALERFTASGLAFRRGTPPDALYIFKHALVQDAAYDSLLKSRRQELHAKIARVIEERFSASFEPAVLAHHYTQAGIPERASAYWLSAGRASYGRSALTEAVRQLRFGLDQIASLPEGATRDRLELDIQLCLGNALIQAKGLASPEADVAFKRGYELRGVLGQSSEMIAILWGIFVVRLIGGQPRAALEIAEELLVNTHGEREADLVARTALMDAHFWSGELETAQENFNRAIALYDDDSDVGLIAKYAFDMKLTSLIYASHIQWMLGYPDHALRTKQLTDAWAKRLDNPFMYAFAYTWGTGVFHYRGDLHEHRSQVEKGLEISSQIGFPHFEGQAELWCAWNRAKSGEVSDENLALFEAAIRHFAGTGSGILVPYFSALRAEALSGAGKTAQALALVRDALKLIDAFGEASHAAEVYRIRATALLRDHPSNADEAEEALRTSLDIARRQNAKSWELRTSTSLARLWRSQGKHKQALGLLKPIYGWFTEGFDTKDLKEAKALLNQLNA